MRIDAKDEELLADYAETGESFCLLCLIANRFHVRPGDPETPSEGSNEDRGRRVQNATNEPKHANRSVQSCVRLATVDNFQVNCHPRLD